MENPPTNSELDLLASVAGRHEMFLGDIERLREHVVKETEVLRELCSGQAKTITSLRELAAKQRAALLYWRDDCTGREPSLSVAQRMTDEALAATPDGLFSVIEELKKELFKRGERIAALTGEPFV